MRRIFGPERQEVVGEQRKLHNEELCNLYPSQNMNFPHLSSTATQPPIQLVKVKVKVKFKP